MKAITGGTVHLAVPGYSILFDPKAAFGGVAGKAKTPMTKLIGAFVLATSYSRAACRRTTIGAVAFHFRVRNGNGWYHYAIVTRILRRNFGAEF